MAPHVVQVAAITAKQEVRLRVDDSRIDKIGEEGRSVCTHLGVFLCLENKIWKKTHGTYFSFFQARKFLYQYSPYQKFGKCNQAKTPLGNAYKHNKSLALDLGEK
jgi:hypothetical protein